MIDTMLQDAVRSFKLLAAQTAGERTIAATAADHVVILHSLAVLGESLRDLVNGTHNLAFRSFEELFNDLSKATSTAGWLMDQVPGFMSDARVRVSMLSGNEWTVPAEKELTSGLPARMTAQDAAEAVNIAADHIERTGIVDGPGMNSLLERTTLLLQTYRDVLAAEAPLARKACMRCQPHNHAICGQVASRIEDYVIAGASGAVNTAMHWMRRAAESFA